MSSKECVLCHRVQPLDNFTPIGTNRHHSYCKTCRRDQAREERRLFPEKNRERKRRYNSRKRQS